MEKPAITVVTITFNAGATIARTLESVASQTYRDYEHLIIDGASRDDTVAIASARKDSRLRILSEPDKGLYDAMNKGLSMARGEFIIFLNAGDRFKDTETLGLYAGHISDKTDIIYGDTEIVDNNGRYLRPRHLSVPRELTRKSFRDGMLVCHQAFMVRRSIAPAYDLRYRFSADYDWEIRCISASEPSRCVNLDRTVISYLDDGLTEKNKIKSLKERLRIMATHYGWNVAIARHLKFIPRLILRKAGFSKNTPSHPS